MKVIEYLKDKVLSGLSADQAFENLTEDFAIKVKLYDEGLAVLNYNQIESPKTNPIVMECRGLILDRNSFEVVSRSFDRFFNLGEAPDTYQGFDITRATVFEKADGSLIKMYYWNGRWHLSTRGTAFAETENYTGKLFRDLVCDAFKIDSQDHLQELMGDTVKEVNKCTFIFELTSPENRIVTRYEKPEMVLIGIKINTQSTEELILLDHWSKWLASKGLKNRPAKTYNFSSEESIKEAVKNLPNLEEGYVCYDPLSSKRVKIKSPAYLAVHKLRGDSIPTPKRIMALVLTREEEEYLAYFPEERQRFQPYIDSLNNLENDIKQVWEDNKEVKNQKEFALEIKHLPYASSLFQARSKQQDPVHCFFSGSESYQMKVLEKFMEGKDA